MIRDRRSSFWPVLWNQSVPAQFFRFGLVGAGVFGADVVVFLTASSLLGLHYLLANCAGKLVGAGLGFLLHRSVTFTWKHRHTPVAQAVFYLALLGGNMLLANTLLFLGVQICRLQALVAKVLSDLVVIIVSFLASRQVVFRPLNGGSPPSP